jgi:HlyD family secretion protein
MAHAGVRRVRWGVGAAAATAAVLVLLAQRAAISPAPRGPGAERTATTRPAPTVAVGRPAVVRLPRTLELTATIASLSEAVLVPRTAGYLVEVRVRPGDAVDAGQVVAVIDHAQLDAQVAQAEAGLRAAESARETAAASLAAARAQRLNAAAGLASAEAALRKAEAERQDSQAAYARTAALAREGAVARQLLDDAEAQAASAEASVEAARAQVAQAAAQVQVAKDQEAAAASQLRADQAEAAAQAALLAGARLQRAYATLTAPFSGIVTSRQLDPGAYVAPGTSTPILTLADLDHLDVQVPVGESDLAALRPGDRVEVRVDAYPGRRFQGVVSRIAGGVDPVTRTVQTEIDLPNPGHLLRPGMSASVILNAGTRPALVVPLSALVTVGSRQFVWVVSSGRATQRAVTTGQVTGEMVEVTGGLTPRDLVIERGADLVRDGQPVRGVPAGH